MKSWCLFQVMFWCRILGRGWISRCSQTESRWHPHDSWALSKRLLRLFPDPVGLLWVVLPWGQFWAVLGLCAVLVFGSRGVGARAELGLCAWYRREQLGQGGLLRAVVLGVPSTVLLSPFSLLSPFWLICFSPAPTSQIHSSPSCYCRKRGIIYILAFGRKFLLNPRRALILGCWWDKS